MRPYGAIGTMLLACSFAYSGPAYSKDFNLKPATSWLMDYAPDSCRLMRAFGEGKDQVVAQFIGYQPGEQFEFNLIGRPMSYVPNSQFVSVRFGAEGEFVQRRAFPGGANGAPALFLAARLDNTGSDRWAVEMGDSGKLINNPKRWLIVDNDDGQALPPGTEARISSATVVIGNRTVKLELGSMAGPMGAMRKCTADLVKEWGLDPDQQAALASHPRPLGDPRSWLRTTYPMDLALDRERALVRFRLMVDDQGKPTTCSVQSNIEIANHFSGPGCAALMKYGRFAPALTATGQSVASYYTLRVAWYLSPSPLDELVRTP